MIAYIYIYIHYAHIASVRFEHSMCRESLITTFMSLSLYLEISDKFYSGNFNKSITKKTQINIFNFF